METLQMIKQENRLPGFETKPTAREALEKIRSNCDGAIAEDGVGFNKFDRPIADNLLENKMTQAQVNFAYKILIKYRRQLAAMGIDAKNLDLSPERILSTDHKVKQHEIIIEGGTVYVDLVYNGIKFHEIKEIVRSCAKWDGRLKKWKVYDDKILQLFNDIKEYGCIEISSDYKTLLMELEKNKILYMNKIKNVESEIELIDSDFTLRNYQKKAAAKGVVFFKDDDNQKNQLMVLPTAAGKSLILSAISQQLNEPLLIFQPTKEILEQNYDKLKSYNVKDVSVYSASFNSKEINKITLATIGSVKTNPQLFKIFKNIIVDECDVCNSKSGMYKEFFEIVTGKILGLTATPYRLNTDGYGGSMLKFLTRTKPRIFEELLHYTQVGELYDLGYLSKLEYETIDIIDSSKLELNSTGADYTNESIISHYQEIDLEGELIKITNKVINERKNVLIFTKFIEEAQHLANNIKGVKVVTSKTSKDERNQLIKDFRNNKIKGIANVGVLTIGFDFPELESIIIARPTRSLRLYYQMVGRAMRTHENKSYSLIVDMGGNIKRFGKIEELILTCDKPNLWYIKNKERQLTNVYYDWDGIIDEQKRVQMKLDSFKWQNNRIH